MAKTSGSGLSVSKIKDGVVIDHIEPGEALNVLKMLNIDGRSGSSVVSVLMHAPSSRMGHKDIVKIENRKLSDDEIDIISLICPHATINDIYKYKVVAKRNVVVPKEIIGSISCLNPSCITNQHEPVIGEFDVMSAKPLRIRCRYCGRDMNAEDVSAYISSK